VLPGDQFAEQPLKPVDGLDSQPGELIASIRQHAQGLELSVGGELAQAGGAQGDHDDAVRVQGVGLAVVAGVEEPDPCGQLGRDIEDLLAGFDQASGQRAACTVGSLDGPNALRPCPHVAAHGCVAGLVGGVSARPQQVSVVVDDLDGGRQFVGIDPYDHACHGASCSPRTGWDGEVGTATTSWAVPS
jgi:hypothetical protein